MNARVQKICRYVICFFVGFVVSAFVFSRGGWGMFDGGRGGGDTQRIERYENVVANATDAVEGTGRGIEHAQGAIDRAEEALERGEKSVGGIEGIARGVRDESANIERGICAIERILYKEAQRGEDSVDGSGG